MFLEEILNLKNLKVKLTSHMFSLSMSLSFILLLLAVPIFIVFGLGSSIAAIWGLNLPWSVLIQISFAALTKHILVADLYSFLLEW